MTSSGQVNRVMGAARKLTQAASQPASAAQTSAVLPSPEGTRHDAVLQPSDGGSIGWMQVAGSFALYFNHL